MIVRLMILALAASLTPAQPLPPIKDWKSVRITLERTSCFGSCPAYEVEIRDGVVRYRGIYRTYVLGQREDKITRAELQQLVDEFRRADYMKLDSSYGGEVMDARTAIISVSIDGSSKTIRDATSADGVEHTMLIVNGDKITTIPNIPDPSSRKAEIAVLKALEKAIDRSAHTDRWVKGEPLPAFPREEFKVTTPRGPASLPAR